MDLARLQTFLRVAQTGSLTAASVALRVAQPALSRQIRLLEDEVGQQLFTRSRTGMALTPAGEMLRQKVGGLLRQLEQGLDDVRGLDDAPQGRVSVGLVPSAAALLGRALFVTVAERYPGIRLAVAEGYTRHLHEWLHAGEVDMALAYRSPRLRLPAETLISEELMLVGRHVPGAQVSMADLAGLPLVLPSAENGLRSLVDAAAAAEGIHLDVMAEASSFPLLLELVRAGLGSSILPRSMLAHLRPEDLAVAAFTPTLRREIQLVSGRADDGGAGRAVAAVRGVLEEVTRDLFAG